MAPRNWVCLTLLIVVASASLCLVPAGQGPYSAVYGPRAPLRAYRASFELMQAVTAFVIVGLANLAPQLDHDASRFAPRQSLLGPSSLHSALRC